MELESFLPEASAISFGDNLFWSFCYCATYPQILEDSTEAFSSIEMQHQTEPLEQLSP